MNAPPVTPDLTCCDNDDLQSLSLISGTVKCKDMSALALIVSVHDQ